ncbi:hypothetical protein B0H14DRAFT_3518739 [Mycena olivaceomarginata]|nr:hypothetical protein B0H14DRAFT_3518739 [Mycena olivaceomarginata]
MASPPSLFRCDPPYHLDPGELDAPLAGRKMYLVCGTFVERPGVYTSWPSAHAQYHHVSGATVKSYLDYNDLRAAWHARCDLGEHPHPANRQHAVATHQPRDQTSSAPLTPFRSAPIASPVPTFSPAVLAVRVPIRRYIIHSRSPSRTPSPILALPAQEDPPPYTAIINDQSVLTASVANLQLTGQGGAHGMGHGRVRSKH